MLSRRERAQRRLSEAGSTKDTLSRRVAAYASLFLFVWLGFCFGLLSVSIGGLLLLGGPKLLSDVWNQSDEQGKLYLFVLFCIFTGGVGGAVLGLKDWYFFLRKTNLISDQTLQRM